MAETDTHVDPALNEEFVRNIRSWQDFRDTRGLGGSLVDSQFVDLDIRNERNPFNEQADISAWLRYFRARVPQDIEEGRVLVARADGLWTYSRAGEGERIPIGEYLSRIVGEVPDLIPSDVLIRQRNLVVDRFHDLMPGSRYNENSWRQFVEDHPPSLKEIVGTLHFMREELIPMVLDVIGDTDLTLDFDTTIVTEDRPFISRVIGGPDRFIHEINLHERNRFRYYPGIIIVTGVHELAVHALQNIVYRRNIRAGNLASHWGVTTIPGVENAPMEGLAQAIAFMLPQLYNRLGDHGRFAVEYNFLRDLILNNDVVILANSEGISDGWIYQHIKRDLLSEPNEVIPDLISLRRDDPRYRAYYNSYARGGLYLHEISKRLDTDEKRAAAVTFLYNTPCTLAQMKTRLDQIADTA